MSKNNKKKNWLKFRHRVVRNILNVTLGIYARLKYRIKVERFREQEKRPYLILYNHQTAFDQFFVGMAFRGPVYYLTSEDIFSKGWVSSLIKYLVAPIPIKKQSTDVKAIMNCIRVSKEGGTIAIAPEGNRTYSGKTEYMSPTIAPLARKLGMPIALYRLEGGYGVHPRWSDKVRRGKMRGYVSRVIYPEEYEGISDDELFKLICDGLYVNEANADGAFRSRHTAEYLERAMYVCPFDGLSEFYSSGDVIACKKCGRRIRYLSSKELSGVGFDFPYRFVSDWYDYQAEFMNGLDVRAFTEEPMYKERAALSEVIPYKNKSVIFEDSEISLYGDRILVTSGEKREEFLFDSVSSVAVLGKNKMNIYRDKKIYQVKGDKRFNALKYVHTYYRYKNLVKGDENAKFLGI